MALFGETDVESLCRHRNPKACGYGLAALWVSLYPSGWLRPRVRRQSGLRSPGTAAARTQPQCVTRLQRWCYYDRGWPTSRRSPDASYRERCASLRASAVSMAEGAKIVGFARKSPPMFRGRSLIPASGKDEINSVLTDGGEGAVSSNRSHRRKIRGISCSSRRHCLPNPGRCAQCSQA
jgi:hypothetical protein